LPIEGSASSTTTSRLASASRRAIATPTSTAAITAQSMVSMGSLLRSCPSARVILAHGARRAGIVDSPPVAAGFLRGVHRLVGHPPQATQCVAVLRQRRDAVAHAGFDWAAVHHDPPGGHGAADAPAQLAPALRTGLGQQ